MKNSENEPLNLCKYKVQVKLGSGSFGNVYKVQNIETYEIYAAKISKLRIRKLKNNPDGLLFLFREIKIMSSLNHPSIIRYIGYSPKDFDGISKPTIITEYAPNYSLKDIINFEKSGLSLSEWNSTRKLIFIYGIASGMSYLHHNNIIHRDLKSENILIDEYFHPKISDFGLSKVVNGITQSLRIQSQSGIKGTLLYMAPETFGGENYSEFSDVFSFGMIIYEIMNIENQFEGFNQYQLFGQYIKGSRPKIDEIVPNAYRELIERCWSQDPKDRPTFNEILEELKNNQDFITDLVDENEFINYVEFIDNCQTSFDLTNQSFHMKDLIDIQSKKFHRMTIQKDDEKIINIIHENEIIEKVGFFSLSEFNQLNSKCQALVKEAEVNILAQCSLGINLIEGKNDFPQKFDIGFDYLKKSQSKGCKESIFYIVRMFIDGIIVSNNKDEASQTLNQIQDKNDPEYFLLSGKIEEKNENFIKAKDYFKKAIKLNNSEAMFCYGKLLFNGKGVIKDEKKAKKYFKLAIKNGYSFDMDQFNNHLKEYKMDDDTFNKIFPKDLKGNNKPIRILTVGDNIGKQYFLYSLVLEYSKEYMPTVFDNYSRFYLYHEQKVKMIYWDTSGQEDLEAIRRLAYCYDDIYLFIFKLTDKSTFKNIFSLWIPDVQKTIKKNFKKYKTSPVFILVGIGFEEWLKDPYNKQYVNQKDIDIASKKSCIYKVIKCSYKTGLNMDKLWPSELIDAYIDVNYPKEYAKLKIHKESKYKIENNSTIQVYCVGQSQSKIDRFLEFIKNGNVDESKIIEIGDFVIAHIFEDKDVFLQFSQVSFQDAFHSQNNKSENYVILLVFSLLNRESFQYLRQEWSNNSNKYPIILIGVENENWDDDKPDLVHQIEINDFAELIGCHKELKCSYLTGNGIEFCKKQIIKSVVSDDK